MGEGPPFDPLPDELSDPVGDGGGEETPIDTGDSFGD